MYIQLGTYKFEGIKLPQSFEIGHEMGYEEIGIIGSKPVVQRTGEKLDTLDLQAYFSTDFCIPETEIELLKSIKKSGEVLQVIDGNGKNYGKFVLKTVSVAVVSTLGNGYITAANVSLSLGEYNSNKVITVGSGAGILSSGAANEIPGAWTDTISISIQKDISKGKASFNKVKKDSKTAPSANKFSKIKSNAAASKAAFNSANTKVNQTKKIIYRAQDLKKSLSSCASAAQSIEDAATINNYNDLLLANSRMEQSLYYLNGANAPVAALIGSREGGDE